MNSKARELALANLLKSVNGDRKEFTDEIAALDAPNVSTLTARSFSRDTKRWNSRRGNQIDRHLE